MDIERSDRKRLARILLEGVKTHSQCRRPWGQVALLICERGGELRLCDALKTIAGQWDISDEQAQEIKRHAISLLSEAACQAELQIRVREGEDQEGPFLIIEPDMGEDGESVGRRMRRALIGAIGRAVGEIEQACGDLRKELVELKGGIDSTWR